MRKANLEVVIRDIETGEELVHDQISFSDSIFAEPTEE
jgi:hypothetical protein